MGKGDTMTPFHRMTKAEILKMANHKCQHGHTFLAHPKCYVAEEERVGYLDIEASNLDADFGIILSWCILDSKTNEIEHDVLRMEDITDGKPGMEDRRIVESLIEALAKYDKIVTYYGKRFDVPYIRTRALVDKVKFPLFGTLAHTDLYFVVRNRFKMSSNRLENACRVLLKKTQKTRIDAKYWRAGTRGDAESLAYILDHNKKDVIDLERLYQKVINFAKKQDTSI